MRGNGRGLGRGLCNGPKNGQGNGMGTRRGQELQGDQGASQGRGRMMRNAQICQGNSMGLGKGARRIRANHRTFNNGI